MAIFRLAKGLVPVLMYHHVGDLPPHPDRIRLDLTVSTSDFSDQIALLDSLGYQTISTDQLYAALTAGAALPPKPIIITFDDGYDDVFANAVPILKQHNMTGTFAIITDFLGGPGYADISTLATAYQQGMELVCHSRHHIDFKDPKYSYQTKFDEIAGCKQDLKDNFGIETSTFIYPYGHFNAEVVKILKAAGFKMAFTTAFGSVNKGQDLLLLPRVRVHGSEQMQTYQKNLGVSFKTR
jgi:peptidoglycan/xylan/chitin deacetylase (PgdA/CDA1 family)